MGRELDEKLAVDSPDGFQRFRSGLVPPKKYRTLGRRSTSRVEIDDLDGALGQYVPSPHDPKRLDVEPIAQIGFAGTLEDPWTWFPVDQLPTKDEIKAQLGASSLRAKFWKIDPKEAFDLLRQRGFELNNEDFEPIPPPGCVRAQFVAKISDPEFRAVSKIGLNYLTHVAGARIALLPQFNPVRRYIRYGEHPGGRPVWISQMSLEVVKVGEVEASQGHYLAVEALPGRVVAQVSLFSEIRYIVSLSDIGFELEVELKKAHFFDIDSRTIIEVEAPGFPTS